MNRFWDNGGGAIDCWVVVGERECFVLILKDIFLSLVVSLSPLIFFLPSSVSFLLERFPSSTTPPSALSVPYYPSPIFPSGLLSSLSLPLTLLPPLSKEGSQPVSSLSSCLAWPSWSRRIRSYVVTMINRTFFARLTPRLLSLCIN